MVSATAQEQPQGPGQPWPGLYVCGAPAGATSARRHRERTKEFKDGYRLRSGFEATNSEYKRRYGGGRLRVRGSPAVIRTVKLNLTRLRRGPQNKAMHDYVHCQIRIPRR